MASENELCGFDLVPHTNRHSSIRKPQTAVERTETLLGYLAESRQIYIKTAFRHGGDHKDTITIRQRIEGIEKRLELDSPVEADATTTAPPLLPRLKPKGFPRRR